MSNFEEILRIKSGIMQRPEGQFPVRPVPEHRADAGLTPTYEDLKATFGVPWVGVITQAVAYYRPFFIRAWEMFAANARTEYFEQRCNDIRLAAWKSVDSGFQLNGQTGQLVALGYSEREIGQIRQVLDIFDYGNPKYLVFATAIKESLCFGRSLGGAAGHERDILPRSPVCQISPIPVMVEEHHAIGGLQDVYADIKATLQLPFINSDYKAMARWPSYLQLAWQDLKPAVGTSTYADARRQVHDLAVHTVESLPHAYCMRHSEALAAGLSDAEAQELMRVISLFQWLLSGLIINVTHFKLAASR